MDRRRWTSAPIHRRVEESDQGADAGTGGRCQRRAVASSAAEASTVVFIRHLHGFGFATNVPGTGPVDNLQLLISEAPYRPIRKLIENERRSPGEENG